MLGRKRMASYYEPRKIWIRKLVSKYNKRYGGDWDELYAEALWLFVIAAHTWNSRKGTLNKHISYRIWVGLREFQRRKAQQHNRHVTLEDIPKEMISYQRSHFLDFFDALSTDAKIIVNHVLRPEMKLSRLIADRDGMRVARRALREYLRNKWDADRINDAFADLEQAINAPLSTRRRRLGMWLDSPQLYA